jgi:hypothetical protein
MPRSENPFNDASFRAEARRNFVDDRRANRRRRRFAKPGSAGKGEDIEKRRENEEPSAGNTGKKTVPDNQLSSSEEKILQDIGAAVAVEGVADKDVGAGEAPSRAEAEEPAPQPAQGSAPAPEEGGAETRPAAEAREEEETGGAEKGESEKDVGELKAVLDARRRSYAETQHVLLQLTKKARWKWRRGPARELHRGIAEADRLGARHIHVGDADRLTIAEGDAARRHIREEARARREEFLKELERQSVGRKEAEAIYEAALAKREYEDARVRYGRRFLEAAAEQKSAALLVTLRKKSVDELSVQEREFYDRELESYAKQLQFKELIRGEYELLQKQKFERLPLKERNIFRRGLNWYLRQPKWKRLVASSLAMTAIAGTGSGAIAAAGFFGSRLVRGAAGMSVSQAIGKLVEAGLSRKLGIQAKKNSAITELAMKLPASGSEEEILRAFRSAEEEYEKIVAEELKSKRKVLVIKAASMMATGAGLGFALSAWGSAGAAHAEVPPSGGSGGVEHAAPPPSHEMTGRAEAPEAPAEPLIRYEHAAPGLQQELQEHLDKLSRVRRGEGLWHPVYRQLEVRIHHHPEEFGLRADDLDNAEKVKAALNRETGKILAREGFLGKDFEYRVRELGVRVRLDADRHVTITGEDTDKLEAWTRAKGKLPAQRIDFDAETRGFKETSVVAAAEGAEATPAEPEAGGVRAPEAPAEASAVGPGYVETAAYGETFRDLASRQLAAHYPEFAKLNHLGKDHVLRFLETESGRAPTGGAPEALPTGTEIYFRGVLESQEDNVRDALAVAEELSKISPREIDVLQSLGFDENDITDTSYVYAIRHMRVGDYIERFSGPSRAIDHGIAGTWRDFEAADIDAQARVVIAPRHINLAEHLFRAASRDPAVRAMTIKEFFAAQSP